MRTITTSLLIAVFGGSFMGAVAQLPPEVTMDRYLLQSEELMARKDYQAALDKMDQILALKEEHNLTLPEDFHFQYARGAMGAGSLQGARAAVTRYLATAGRDSKFYWDALKLFNQVEAIQKRLEQYPAQVEQLLSAKDSGAALELMNQIVGLQEEHRFPLPEEFPFQYAQAALAAGAYWAAADSVNKYLGGEGKFYQEAQELLVQVRERVPIKPEMVVIPGGRFRMGCVSGLDCFSSEQPVHTVRVGRFELSKYEVTFEEYDRFTAATGRARASDEGWGRGRRPVINVSWEDAVAYTRWLSQQTGQRYRLPSEAEWEYAVRAGTETKYSWGNENEIGHNRTNCDFSCGDQWRWTAPVGSFPPNVWGLHDMHGNVFEWVQDCWNESYQGAPTDGSAWESGDCSRRVVRGGSWVNTTSSGGSPERGADTATTDSKFGGFRVARTIKD